MIGTLEIDKNEEFETESQVFDAGNIKAECGGWCGWVDIEKVKAVLQFSYAGKSQENIIRHILCYCSQKKWENRSGRDRRDFSPFLHLAFKQSVIFMQTKTLFAPH